MTYNVQVKDLHYKKSHFPLITNYKIQLIKQAWNGVLKRNEIVVVNIEKYFNMVFTKAWLFSAWKKKTGKVNW